MKFCQSCGMPLTDQVLGTNADGSKEMIWPMGTWRGNSMPKAKPCL